MRKLAERSGRSLSQIGVWSSNDPDGSWKEQRERYQHETRTEIKQRAIERTADLLSEEISQLSVEHFDSLKKLRQLAEAKLNDIHQKVYSSSHPEYAEANIEKINPLLLESLSRTLTRCIEWERRIMGLEYESVNMAIKVVEQSGLVVNVPAKAIEAQNAMKRLKNAAIEE